MNLSKACIFCLLAVLFLSGRASGGGTGGAAGGDGGGVSVSGSVLTVFEARRP